MTAPHITPLPTPPSRSQSPDTFSTDADAFLGALPDFQSDANAQADYLDGLADQVTVDAAAAEAAAAIAAGAANYMGDYNALTTYQIGESVSYNGRRYVAKTVNTGITPADGANWFLINDGDVLGPVSATNNGIALFDGTTGKIIKSGLDNGTAGQVLTSGGGGNTPTWSTISLSVQYPQNVKSADYTLTINDAGKQIFHPASDGVTRTYTIPANATVPFPIGTVILFTVENFGKPVDVNIVSDTLVFGDGTTGSISVAASNTLMAIKVSSTKWMASYLYQTGAVGKITQSVAITHETTPHLRIYQWSASGFGSYFTPPGAPGNTCYGAAFNPAGNVLAVTNVSNPYIYAYPWSPSTGLGTKFGDPSTTPSGWGYDVAFHPAGNVIALSHDISPFISAYRWSSTGFGTKFSNPATLPTGTGVGINFNPAGDTVALAHVNSPFVTAYRWSSTGFGTKFANPGTLPTGMGGGVAFNPAGDVLAVAHATSPAISVYPWSSSTGFGTKFANPGTLPAGVGNKVVFSPLGDSLVVAHMTSPFVSAYSWSGSGFGTKFANPATLPASHGEDVAFSADANVVAVTHSGSPYITAYSWSSSTGFGTKFADPSSLPPGNAKGVAFGLSL